MKLKDIKNFIDMADDGDRALHDKLEIFIKRRENLKTELSNLQDILGIIEYKCWYYTKACEAGTEEAMKNLTLSDIPQNFREARKRLHCLYKKFWLFIFEKTWIAKRHTKTAKQWLNFWTQALTLY